MKSTIINSNVAQDAIIPAIVISDRRHSGGCRNPAKSSFWIPGQARNDDTGIFHPWQQSVPDEVMMYRLMNSAPPQAPGANHA